MLDEESLAAKVLSILFFAAVMVPSLALVDLGPARESMPDIGWIAIAGVCGAIGLVLVKYTKVMALISGAVGGVCVAFATILYVKYRADLLESNTFHIYEFVIPAAIGALPGWIVWKFTNQDGE